jgi:nicotinamide-nucleotide amidase
MPDDIDLKLVEQLAQRLLRCEYQLSTAESCTGGGIGYRLTAVPGSSLWYLGGYITYSNQAKIRDIGVKPKTLETYGAVSEQVAIEMALGCAKTSGSDLAISVTGIAGPEGGSRDKPVGTVCFGWVLRGQSVSETIFFDGDRETVRVQTIRHALEGMIKLLEKFSN